MTPEHTDMTGAARLREAARKLLGAAMIAESVEALAPYLNELEDAAGFGQQGQDRRSTREALAAVPEDPESQDDLLTITLRRGQWMVILGAASDYGKRVPLEQGDGGACLDAIREALGERVEEGTER